MLESFALAVQNTHEVDQYCFPDVELNLMHKVHNHHTEQAKAVICQSVRKYILETIS